MNYLQLALEESFFSIGVSRPNPAVGAVVVKDGIVVGKGRTQRPGSAHAEVMALRDAGELARGAAIYVTLEPCCHYGRTPPCTKAIIDAGIEEVYFAHADPNPVVRGNSRKVLEEAGVRVFEGVEACIAASFEEADEGDCGSGCRVFGYDASGRAAGNPVPISGAGNVGSISGVGYAGSISGAGRVGAISGGGMRAPSEAEIEGRSVFAEIERYFEAYDYFVRNKMTFVEVKCAVSESGFMGVARPDGSHAPLCITGQGANCWNHELRAMSDAVLVGAGTLLADNPSLDVRYARGNNPVKVLWAGHRVFGDEDVRALKFFNAADCAAGDKRTLVFSLVEQPAVASLPHVEVVHLGAGDFAACWREMLAELSRRGMHRLMVEPGATLAHLLFDGVAGDAPENPPLWNRLDLWHSTDPRVEEVLEGGDGKPALTAVAFPGVPSGAVARESAMLGPDVLTIYYPS
ncbi:diaminohydroxyphosphoribosylaminopyrimidine deaminase [Fibrobacter sp. UWT3]|uniref:bifunctional diaminohydroxyphosphoribosylaminopyrimidine deaminase/5-amino-6-(5-phosphoribosylamino)uracil reductase RibD n=1 Tax=Fibrobacter sp. UWT3 TaxID=1896225 RepID=UPI000BC560FB|nr:dihydrofolate reductase family protein [Fibrobacter sp. UWT3]SOE56525.1 diaminohydroxyphosphoribosylaminopyrimidine deaminase [Fibrobacter sp. UWT3]